MNKWILEIDLPDDFQKGDCDKCPLFHEWDEWFDDDGYNEVDFFSECFVNNGVVVFSDEQCPLKKG